MLSRAQLLLLLAFTAFASAQTRPLLKIGTTMAHCGTVTERPLSISIEKALFWFANYTNEHGGVLINGTVHDIQLIR